MPDLLLASNNPGKLREMEALLAALPLRLLTPAQIGLDIEVEESGSTYQENASLKAHNFAQSSGLISLADDSGLEVDALGGQPGLHSKRFAPIPGATDADRRAYLLELLLLHPQPWRAHFHCTVAIGTPSGKIFLADGDCYGEIIPEERGSDGFGYDPIFLVEGLDRTMAELSLGEKNQLSHRARAVRAAVPILDKILFSS